MRRTRTLLAVAGVAAVALPGSAVALSPQSASGEAPVRTAAQPERGAGFFDDAALQPVEGRDNIYYIKAKHSGKCLTVRGASKAENAPVNQYRCVSATNQWWVVQNMGGLARRLVNYNSQKALSLKGGSMAKGTPLVQRTYDADKDQIWWVALPNTSDQPSVIFMENGTSDRCADVQGASTADNAPVIAWTCNRKSNQKWMAAG
ncbi:RICIN domain-containing protein [Streptomyces monticola]|uniref:RICIN domain-containing protein n=1 Tax=Streptomyces monticola TaxID=2666263 RepID=A0ABW2JS00_9ACTN